MNCTRTIRSWTWSVSGRRIVLSPSCDGDANGLSGALVPGQLQRRRPLRRKGQPVAPGPSKRSPPMACVASTSPRSPRSSTSSRTRRTRGSPTCTRSRAAPRSRRPTSITRVLTFAIYELDELVKFLEVTGKAKDLNMNVRLSVVTTGDAYSMALKFGVEPQRRRRGLLLAARRATDERDGRLLPRRQSVRTPVRLPGGDGAGLAPSSARRLRRRGGRRRRLPVGLPRHDPAGPVWNTSPPSTAASPR